MKKLFYETSYLGVYLWYQSHYVNITWYLDNIYNDICVPMNVFWMQV